MGANINTDPKIQNDAARPSCRAGFIGVDGWREERRLGADLLLADALEAVERHAAADVGEPARGVGDAAEGVQPAEALSEERLVAVGQEEGALGGTFGVEVAEAVAEVN